MRKLKNINKQFKIKKIIWHNQKNNRSQRTFKLSRISLGSKTYRSTVQMRKQNIQKNKDRLTNFLKNILEEYALNLLHQSYKLTWKIFYWKESWNERLKVLSFCDNDMEAPSIDVKFFFLFLPTAKKSWLRGSM